MKKNRNNIIDKMNNYLSINEGSNLEKDAAKIKEVDSVYKVNKSVYIETGNVNDIIIWLEKNKSKYKIKKIKKKDVDIIKVDI